MENNDESLNVSSFELASLLKKLNFSWPTTSLYKINLNDGELLSIDTPQSFNKSDWCISAPTLSLVQKFLRDNYNFIVQITAEAYNDGINWLWQTLIYEPNDNKCHYWDKLSTDNMAIMVNIPHMRKHWKLD